MNQYLFLFTIGPVQSFIEQARKTQDLYAGSLLLSDLIDFAIADLQKALGRDKMELIFPHASIDSKPNRFIASIHTNKDIQQLGDDLKKSVQGEFLKQAQPAMDLFPSSTNVSKQLKDFLKIHWVALFYTPSDYEKTYAQLEQMLGAVKNIRNFEQFAERGRKCSVNGEYNVLFYRKTEAESTNNRVVEGKKRKLFQEKGEVQVLEYDDKPKVLVNSQNKKVTVKQLQQGEGLSAISFFKRLYKVHQIDNFPSTAKIALIHTLQEVEKKAPQVLTNFEKVFGNKNIISAAQQKKSLKLNGQKWEDFDDQFYFEENLISKRIPCNAQLQLVKEHHKKIGNILTKNDLKWNKYYALIHFDGDKMGAVIAGDRRVQKQTNLQDFQNKLSKLLGDFAEWATAYIDGKDFQSSKGKTVYAGGDDFLGFINLNYLFEVIQELHKQFKIMVNDALQQNAKYALTQDFTFSAGVTIAHYKEPLSLTLKKARLAEKTAKEEGNRNAFCLVASKHSGVSHEAYYKWTFKNGQSVLEVANDLLKFFNENLISRKFLQNLGFEFDRLMAENGLLSNQYNHLVEAELTRLMLRAKSKEANTIAIEALSQQLFEVYESSQGKLQNFLQFLYIIEFISRQTN